MTKAGERLINSARQERVKYMIKYFFGWFKYNGRLQSTSWMEENGIAVGGPRDVVQKTQIAENYFQLPLKRLEEIYPRPTLPLE